MLLVEQEPYVLQINLNYTNLGYKIYTTTHKNHMQKNLDAIIGENQLVATKNRTTLNTFSMVRGVIDVPYKSNLALKSLNFREPFTEQIGFPVLGKLALPQVCYSQVYSDPFKFGYGEKFVHMIEVAYNNIQSKTKINGLLSDFFTLI